MRCCVPFCENTSGNVSNISEFTFYTFPDDKHLRAAWLRALSIHHTPLPDSAVVCSQHFLHDDICKTISGSQQLRTDAVPSTVQVCITCLNTNSKMFLMNEHKLDDAYEKLTGFPLCEGGNLKPTICVQCAQRLRNFSRFREMSLRARSLMMELVARHETITKQHINSATNQLKNKFVLTTLGPDHCDLHIVENYDEDIQPTSEKTSALVKNECSDDSILVEINAETINEDRSNANHVNIKVTIDPLKYENAPYMCIVCDEEFPNEHAYRAHLSTHQHGDPSTHSAQTTLTPLSARHAIKTENEEATEEADSNPDNFAHTQDVGEFHGLHTHYTSKDDQCRAATYNKPATSRLCDMRPCSSATSSLSKKKSFTCDVCQRVFTYKSKFVTHMRSHTGEKPYSCKLCTYKCAENCNLVRHMKTHTGEKPYSCKLCKYKCAQSSSLAKHMMGHTGERPFSCDLCEYKSVQSSSLARHMMTHTGEKPFFCDMCAYKCAEKIKLIDHIRIHTGVKPYSCNICSFKFIKKSDLARHVNTHTGEKPYSCNFCEFRSGTKGSLVQHVRIHTGEKPYSCNFCKNKFSHRSNLVSHGKRCKKS